MTLLMPSPAPNYRSDREWADQFIPTIKQIVGPLLLVPAPLEVDRQQAADLITLRARDLTIGARVRRPNGYAKKYPNQFTIRSRRDSGAETELQKLIDGWGDWMFYGHAAAQGGNAIWPWVVIDLSAWRSHLIRRASRRQIKTGEQPNGDGTYFQWFDYQSFPPKPPLVVAEST